MTSNARPLPSAPQPNPAEMQAEYTFSLRRLRTLLPLAKGAWVLAVYQDGATLRLMLEALRQSLAPLLVREVSLLNCTPDPLAILRSLPAEESQSVVVFTDIDDALPELCGYLDSQREALARLPQRLLFGVTPDEQHIMAEHAPNFYSRVSGIFPFHA
ncbi:MAG: hypothetical protein ACRD6I_20695 [Candidatus Acidiferrales bacterium]